MNKDEMIEEMGAIMQREHMNCMSNFCNRCSRCEYNGMEYCANVKKSNALYNAGYRKVADDEIVESMKTYERARQETARDILQELYSTPHEYHEKKIVDLANEYGIELE